MQTSDNLKNYLKDLTPEIFFEIEEDTKILDLENGFNFKGFGLIFLNKKSLLNKYENDPTSYEYNGIEEEKRNKSYALKVAKALIHESFAKNKYIFNSPQHRDSSLNFFDNKNTLVNFVPQFSKLNEELFDKGTKSNKGENGKFLELFFGKFRNKLVIELLLEIDDVIKLYDSIYYFVKENLEEIKKYTIMKYSLKEKGIIYKDNSNLNLDEENKNLEIYDKKYNTGFNESKNDDIFKDKQSIDISTIILFENQKKTEFRGYDYFMKKSKEAKDPSTKAYYLFELLKYLKT